MNFYYSARAVFLLVLFIGPAGISLTNLQAQAIRPSTQKEIRVVDPVNPTNGSVALKAVSGTATYVLQFPTVVPTANQFLGVSSVSAGVANLAWSTPSSGTGSGSGSNGQVTYWTGTNSQAGSNDLFWDAGNKRLGIGTNSPMDKLSINEPSNADLTVSMMARGGYNRRAQLNFGAKNNSNVSVGGAIGSIGNLEKAGLVLNGNTGDISSSNVNLLISSEGEIFINSNGNGNNDEGNYKLQVNGDLVSDNARFRNVSTGSYSANVSLSPDGTLLKTSSDGRLKKNVEVIKTPLEKVMALRGVTYNWKDSLAPRRMMGMIAQEVLAVVPELVFQNESDGFYGINYGETSALLIEAIKEQQKMIQELKKDVSALQIEISSIKKELNSIKPKYK
jgi:hypothetical protein